MNLFTFLSGCFAKGIWLSLPCRRLRYFGWRIVEMEALGKSAKNALPHEGMMAKTL
jgi:hypothetical protein